MKKVNKYSRSRTRKFLYQMLYAQTFWPINKKEFIDVFYNRVFKNKLDKDYLYKMNELILDYEYFFINIIQKYAPKFKVEKMDLSYILPIYISICEIIIMEEEIPIKVSINEAIEIAKIYWDDSSRKIVNWVLNNVLKDIEKITQEFKSFNDIWKNKLLLK